MNHAAAARAGISTNDRSQPPVRLLRGALALLARTAPSLAAEAASRLFVLVPRIPRPWGEAAAFLTSGEALKVRSGGRRLTAWSWGQGPAIVLAHGWGGRGSQMRAFVPPLVDAGYRAVVFDGPAHGFSGGFSTNLPAFGDAIAAVVGTTGARGVIAHSMGGASTLVALSRGLSLSRAVLIGAPSNAERIWRGFSRAVGLPDAVAIDARGRLERRIGVNFRDLNVSSFAARIPLPVLVVHDRDDEEVPWSAGEENARLLPGGRLVTTCGLGHRRTLRDSAVIEQAVRFLEDGIAPGRCEKCHGALGSAGSGTFCGSCALGSELFERDGRFAA
ncbi:MAG: alpha/beta hydrolase [Thermoanaerobaculia bacterium]